MTTQDEQNDQEWANPTNWRGPLSIYSSKADDRIWVPKRDPRTGMTLNFAHRGARWSLLGLFIVPLAFVLLAILRWVDSHT